MTDYRVGLPTSLFRDDGSAQFPTYSLDTLGAEDGVDISYFESHSPMRPGVIDRFNTIVLLGERFDADSAPESDTLIHLARMGVGYDTVDVDICTQNDIVLTITPDAVRRPMAVATLTYLLALAGNLIVKDRLTRQGPDGWAQRTFHHGTGLRGRILGIIGLGNIGSEVARLAAPFGLRIIASDPYIDPAHAAALNVDLVSQEEVFKTADFVSLNCPLTDETRHLANADTIGMMKTTAFLINTARGPVADQTAVYEALKGKRIAGAGLDVLVPEPTPIDEPLNELDNVIMAPHALGWTDEIWTTMAEVNEAAIRAIMSGQPPQNAVNPEVFDRAGFQQKLTRISAAYGEAGRE
jgi:phosphoglycerate dehydrogenase-like enzyme